MKIELTSEDVKVVREALRDKILYYHIKARNAEKDGRKDKMIRDCELENQLQEVLDKFDN